MAQKLYSCQHAMEEEKPGPCAWCESNLLFTLKCLTSELSKARMALNDLFLMMDEGVLVRNTDDDGKPDFALRMLSIVERLKAAHDAAKDESPSGPITQKENEK